MKNISLTTFLLFVFALLNAQDDSFPYNLKINPVSIEGLTGLHSYSYAQKDNKWLIIGGRTDGIHARQPFNAFPKSRNNTDIFLIDIQKKSFKKVSIENLPVTLKEQLQATNANFYQKEDTLYIVGGYAFAESKNDHITFPALITVQVSGLIDAIENNQNISPFFKQLSDDRFAVTGGELAFLGEKMILVGGHRFDGRYNPMDNPTFVQTYTNQIRKFKINNSGEKPVITHYEAITDEVHLRRRDYNLLPQIFPDGKKGFMISSGVFQKFVDLPFLYPVDIREEGYFPRTEFNQYLNNYHSAKASLYSSKTKQMHGIFFGGISQYYYENGKLIKDDAVPFVKTVSRLTRFADGSLREYQMPILMPELQGASAEFIPNLNLPHDENEIIKLDEITEKTFTLGHIFGGIHSRAKNPFDNNQTNLTQASNVIYEVILEKNSADSTPTAVEIDGKNPFECKVYPNPSKGEIFLEFDLPYQGEVFYFLSDTQGKILDERDIEKVKISRNKHKISLQKEMRTDLLLLTVVFDDKFYRSFRVVFEK